MTSTHKVTAYFPNEAKPRITYHPSKGDAVEAANDAKIAGATRVNIQMV